MQLDKHNNLLCFLLYLSIESHMGKRNNQAKAVYIDGNTYDTASDAFNAVSPSCKYVAFCKRLRSTSKKYNNWYYL